MNNIRLLQIIPTLNSGGVERGALDIAEAITKTGNISVVASNGGRLVSRLERSGSTYIKIPVHSKNPFIIYNNINNLKKIISSYNINIMHTRSRAPAWSSYYAGRNKIKLVSTFHNVYGYQNYFKRYYNSRLAKVDAIIAISNYVKNEISKIYNIPKEKITVIHRGIDEENFRSESINEDSFINFIKKYNLSLDKKIILFPARLTNWKGQIEFLKVLIKLKNKNFLCLFVGDDKNQHYTKKLVKEINNSGLGSFCRILGHIDDIKYIYKLSDIVVNASQKPEGFGRIISEAMAMQKPVIAFNQGGVSEQIVFYDDNFKIPFNDINKMSKVIDQLLIMPKESLKKLGELSRKFVLENFTKKKMIFGTINFYKNLLNKNNIEQKNTNY